MKLLFKQRFFSWFDSYDIYDEFGKVMFEVKGQLSWGKRLEIYDASGAHLGTLCQKVFQTYYGGRPVYINCRNRNSNRHTHT